MRKVKHIVFLRFKPGTTESQIEGVFDQLLDISESIPGVEDYVAGPNNSPEGKSQGYTHAFIMTFTDATARDAYLPHPDHQKFTEAAGPLVESVAVMDFEL